MAIMRLRPLETLTQKKAERNRRLSDSDWTQMADSPLSATEKSAWAKYRQALRDMDFQGEWPLNPDQEKMKPASGKRAYSDDGKFQADDPETPEINEAYEDGKTPKKRTRKKKA